MRAWTRLAAHGINPNDSDEVRVSKQTFVVFGLAACFVGVAMVSQVACT
jgi:hypothetical protein